MRLTQLFIYPVKGMRGISLDEAAVERCGLAGDRRWLVVDERGQFLTQRQIPRMARLDAIHADGKLALRFGTDRIEIAVPDAGSDPIEVTIWRDRVAAVLADAAAGRWLSHHLGRACRLVYLLDPQARAIDPAYTIKIAPTSFAPVSFAPVSFAPVSFAPVSFADGFPILLTTTGSLGALNRALARPVGMDRFRPNLVVEGTPPWVEDTWQRLRIGTTAFRAPKPCTRCVVITIDQISGEIIAPGEPLRTLGRLNRAPSGIVFGCNLIPETPGTVQVGDIVQILD